jgi:hypothetical protein
MIDILGKEDVGKAYRRDLSGVGDENKVAELLCEITVCAAIVEKTGSPAEFCLHPQTNANKHCDFRAKLGGHTIWGEIKRFEDNYFSTPHFDLAKGRALSMSAYEGNPGASFRPRSEDLRSKLAKVPRQFLEGEINVLFIFHSSYGESAHYLQAALLGDSCISLNKDAIKRSSCPKGNALFALKQWNRVSACCLTSVHHGGLAIKNLWYNLNASASLPAFCFEQ